MMHPTALNEYYEYKVTPTAGNSFNVTSLSGEHSVSNGNWITAAFYSLNNFSSETQIGSNVNINTGTSTTFSFTGLGISVPIGATLTIRIYAWESDNNNRSYRNKNIVISGTTSCAPMISSQSSSAQSVCAGTSFAPISVTASGTNLTYQWYRNTSASNSGGISLGTATGAQTSTYTPLNNVQAGTNYYYYCVVSNGCGSETSSVSGAFLVSSASSVGTIQTSSVSICSGSSTTLVLSTPNNGSIQWQQSANGTSGWASVTGGSGSTSTNYSTPSLSSTTYYRVRVTNGGCASVFSNTATVTITAPASAGTISGTQTICSTETTQFTSDGNTGGSWSSGNTSVATINSSGLVSGVSAGTATMTYSVTATGVCTNTATATITITVNPAPTAVTASTNNSEICLGSTTNLTSSAGSNSNTALTIISESFNQATNNWTVTNTSANGTPANAAWTLRPNGYNYNSGTIFNSNDASQFYLSNSDAQGSGGNTSTVLQSPSFSTEGLSAASLSFFHYYRDYDGNDNAVVEVSTNGGTSWSTINTYNTNTGNLTSFANATFSLNSYLNQPTVIIRYRYTAVFGYYWAIDNVLIQGTYSSPPAATFAWTSSPAGYTSSTQNPTGVSPTETTTYSVTATNNYGCSTSASATITVNPIVTPTFTQVSAICSGASLSALPTTSTNGITGTWSPALNNTATTTYTFTPTAGQCATTASMTITVNPVLTASVSISASSTGICTGNSVTFTATPTNGGTSPAYVWKKNGSVVSGQTSSTFTSGSLSNGDVITCEMTSNASPCLTGSPATSNSISMTVNPIVTPTFTQVSAICSGASLSALPTTSTNGITGTWSPALNNTATTTYTFTPTAGQCASTATMTITVNPVVTPTFTQVSAICSGASLSALPTTSNNSITGTWSPALNNTATTTYTFTPTAGQCATTASMTITVNASTTYYQDADGDGFGTGTGSLFCTAPISGYSNSNNDCDDNNAAANPEATELCTNTFDDNCDGNISEEFPGGSLVTYYLDQDSDGSYSANSVQMCAAPSGLYTTQAPLVADCNDNNFNIKPSGVEICGNEIDEDCTAGDLVPGYYKSIQSGAWNNDATWSYSCDNSVYNNAYYFPPVGYNGFVLIAEGTTVTIPNNGEVFSTGTLQINATGSLSLTGNAAVSSPTAGTNVGIAKLTVSNTIINNGTLTIGHMASLLQSNEVAENVNTGTGNFVVNMNLTGTSNAGGAPNGRYWYIGSPMNNTNVSNTFYSATHKTRVWDYLPATNAWNAIINGTTGFGEGSATNMTVGLGYLYRAGSNQTVTFTGDATEFNNNITTPITFTGTGYKYVANPYTSYVDWKLVTRTGLNVSYWIRNAQNTSYESYNATSNLSTNNGSGQTTQFIPPMQGFWIYAFTTPCSLRMDNGDRRHSSNILHAPIHNQVVRLNLNDGKTDDQAVVYENENASNGIEEYDTDKFMDENYHQVYFLEGTKQVSLDGLKDATAKQKVDMGIQITGAGTYTINAVELGVEEDVVLEDKFTHTFQDLKRNSTYSFTSNAGTYNNRFVLHFTLNPQTETSMESVAVTEEVTEVEGVQVYTTTGQQVKVWVTNTTDFQNATVKVYDAIGNMIERKNMTSNELLLDLNTATGVYLVEVTGDSKVFTKKIFIAK